MNKKLLFAAMSLVAFTACTDTDFESQKVAEETSTVQFEVINANDAFTRASMGGTDNNTISWSAKDGDLFTLYFGASSTPYTSGYDNATYTAKAEDGKPASLTTPTMIKEGQAIMYWPVDTTFRIKTGDALTIKIPVEQVNTADEIPYVSDRITIGAYGKYNEKIADGPVTAWNTAGKDRKYPVYMRPMASQLNLKANYEGTDAKLKELEEGEDGITPIEVTSIDLLTNETGSTLFTKEIPVKFNETANTAWTAVEKNAFSAQTQFDVAGIVAGGQTAKLTAKDKCLLPNNVGAKILILPQANIAAPGVDKGAVVVNTIYGKVVVAPNGVQGSKYKATPVDEAADAWARYIKKATVEETYETKATTAEADGENKGKYKTTSSIAEGMMQTINAFSSFKAPDGLPVKGEDMGTAINRYVKVLLTHLDMSDLHIKNDKQLRDAARVWEKLGLDNVTVFLDGDAKGEFKMSQKTITLLNKLNKGTDGKYKSPLPFTVKPCIIADPDEDCQTIVITGGGDVQDMAFIVDNGGTKADVAFNEGETWNWKGEVKVGAAGVKEIYNRGTLENSATGNVTLKTAEADGTQNDVRLVNNGTWNVKAGTLFVQFDVLNNGKVDITKGAELREDGSGHIFYNYATNKPSRFGGDDKAIGVVENKGVFATVNDGVIYNYGGLIEHADVDAKTYITKNQLGGNFAAAFSGANKMGRINLPYSNKDEDNISVNSALDQGFISVTVDGEVTGALKAEVLGSKVNYVIIKSGVTEIQKVAGTVKYLEINEPSTEIAWKVSEASNYDGLMVLSKVNITQGTNVTITKATYLGATMYVGGVFAEGSWNGYYGNTTSNFATMYVTY